MNVAEKLKALQSLELLDQIPADKLATLSAFLQPVSFEDGAVVFDQGDPAYSFYFVSRGHVRISKRVTREDGSEGFMDLAIIDPGESIGEMSLMQPGPRSARATAQGETLLFQLARGDLMRWLDSNPALALGFFAELVQVLSRRLRRSSNELALLFDLSQWLLEPIASGKELVQKVLGHLVPHLEGAWSASAYLYNEFNDEMECVDGRGEEGASVASSPRFDGRTTAWLDGCTIAVALSGPKRLDGYLILKAEREPAAELKNEVARTLATAAGLLGSALENIRFRTEDQLRARLRTAQAYGGSL